MIASLVLFACHCQGESAQSVYEELQRRLGKVQAIEVVTTPTTGNAWDHETNLFFRRPTMAAMSGWGIRYRTNGKRTLDQDRTFKEPFLPLRSP
jgi:hypothetical protein